MLSRVAVAVLAIAPFLWAEEPLMLTVKPVETDELLANPGIGWETFHQTRKQDRNLPDWIPSTVHYARWGWGALKPQPGRSTMPSSTSC